MVRVCSYKQGVHTRLHLICLLPIKRVHSSAQLIVLFYYRLTPTIHQLDHASILVNDKNNTFCLTEYKFYIPCRNSSLLPLGDIPSVFIKSF